MADDTDIAEHMQKMWDSSNATDDEKWQQKRRLADAMRLVIDRLVPSNAPETELRAAADGLERYAEQLKKHPRLERVMGHAETATAGNVAAFFDQSPLIGLANPLAPPIRISRSGETSATATATFGTAYEGPPGSVHGGFVAAAFDEVLGFVQSLGGNPGFTGTLKIIYRTPTPLHTELRFTCALDRVEGRKTFCVGQLYASEQLCAEAEGIFVKAKPGKLEALQEKRVALEASLTDRS